MSAPNRYLPGTFYEVTRRTVERMHKLTPDYSNGGPYTSSIEQMYKYATAFFAKRFDITVIASCIMSNHMHEILFDRSGRIAEFLQKRNAMFANMVKVRYGLAGGIFDRRSEKYNRLLGPRALVEKIAYVIANPVAAGLVASPEEWPGYVTRVTELCGSSVQVRRPSEYLSQNDKRYPPILTFSTSTPPEAVAAFSNLSELVSEVHELLERNIKRARRLHAGRFVGRARVRATNPRQRVATFEVFGARTPRFTAAGDRSAARKFLQELRAFWRAHRAALEAVRAGRHRVVFPAGTGKMHFTYGFQRELAPSTCAA